MTREEAMEKIRKLLRMKHGGTPDEVATALRLAKELAQKHGIELDKVDPDVENERPIGHQDFVHGARVQWECIYAAQICDKFFNVRAFQAVNEAHTKYVMRFVGTGWDTQIAIYVYTFLCGHFRREWATRKRKRRLRNRQAFMWGMYLGLAAKLRERQPEVVQEPGIVLLNRGLARCNAYIAARWELKSENIQPDGKADRSRYAGYIAGQETEIRSGVKGSQPKSGQITSGALQLTFQ